MTDAEFPSVVIDNGSFSCKIGIGGDDAPSIVFPNIVGPFNCRLARDPILLRDDAYIGSKAQIHRSILSLSSPINRGIVTNWPDMERIWTALFSPSHLSIHPSDHNFLLTEPPHNPRSNREKMAEIFLERFLATGIHIAIPGYLSIFAAGRNTGLALDCGDGVMTTFSVTNGHTFLNANLRTNFAGADIVDSLQRLLTQRGVYLNSSAERELVREIKETQCFVSEDYIQEMDLARRDLSSCRKTYMLPDGQKITLGPECFEAPEALFTPSLLGVEHRGIHHLVFDSLMKCDIDSRRDLAMNIILTGGSTLYPGFAARLGKELSALVPARMGTKIIAPKTRLYDVWIGGSMLTSLSSFQKMWITRQEYEETGAGIMHRKCFPNVI